MRFDERWISDPQLEFTAALAKSTGHLAGEVVEIGTWQGLSAIPIANAVHPAALHVVDHWLGDEAIRPELTARDNYGIFRDNIKEGTAGNVIVWKMDWKEFVKIWDRPIRFLHLDAAHTTDEVSANIAALLPHAVDGAVFCGDDWAWETVRAGVHQHFPEVNSGEDMWWTVIGGAKELEGVPVRC